MQDPAQAKPQRRAQGRNLGVAAIIWWNALILLKVSEKRLKKSLCSRWATPLLSLGVTTYAENIGVMAVTRIYSTLIFIIAAIVAILLGFCPKFGALIGTIPSGVIGGPSIVLFGLIAATAGRIWVQNGVDFSKKRSSSNWLS